MALSVNAAYCAIVATAFWMLLGFALGRRLLPKGLAIGAAPILGWAVHSAVTLPIFMLIGFSYAAVASVAVLCAIASITVNFLCKETNESESIAIPLWAFAGAAALALVPASAIVPKISAESVHLASGVNRKWPAVCVERSPRACGS